jgi:hypothetical protein
MSNNLGNFGLSLYGQDPYGAEPALFGVAGATSYSPHFVQVRFTDLLDFSFLPLTDPTNYSISPTLVVHSVIVESADSVVLATDAQSAVLYTVTVTAARSFFGTPMVPPNNTATFTGSAFVSGGYFAVGTSPTRVRCIFSTQMQLGADLTNPANYTVTDLNGTVLPVLSAQPEQTGNPFSVVLTLGVPMQTTSWYQTILSPALVDIHGNAPKPSAVDFQWVLPAQNIAVPISEFTGEATGGPFGNHNGLVFFSPSLNVAASNSTIQVEEVDVCTKAYDEYHPPVPLDPAPFFLWSQIGPQTTLGEPGIVLFGGFPFLSEAKFEVEFTGTHVNDLMPEAFDGSCSVVLKASFAPTTLFSLLNDTAWSLFAGNDVRYADISAAVAMSGDSHTFADTPPDLTDAATVQADSSLSALATVTGTESCPPMFVCADNSVVPTPGSETIIVLRHAIMGNSSMVVAEPDVVHWASAAIEGDSTFATTPQAPPTSIQANSWMRVGRPSIHFMATVSMVSESHMTVNGPPHPTPPVPQHHSVSSDMNGYAIVEARVEQAWTADAEMNGNASIFVRANRHVFVSSTIVADSSATGTATKGPTATAALTGGSTVTAHAVVNHPVSASLSGHSTMTASGT